MKNSILIISMLLCSYFVLSQDKGEEYILKADTTWSKEIIPFPIHFAPEIEWKGYEDAQFMSGWGKQDSPEFWSYIFAWNIEESIQLTKSELESSLQFYFDGLMEVVNKDKDKVLPPTNVVLQSGDPSSKDLHYIGKINVYDSFRTKKMITLNTLVEIQRCANTEKTIIIFRFSLKDFEHYVWSKLKEVGLRGDVCTM